MAPEIMLSEKYSNKSDVYAFGFIMFEILSGEEPFKNFSIQKLFSKICEEGYRPPIKDDISDAYKNLIDRCWAQNPEQRPEFNEIVNELKSNSEFITPIIDELEFYDYVDFIDKYRSTFDVSNRVIHFADFIQSHGRNKSLKTFSINPINSDEKDENDENNSITSTDKNENSSQEEKPKQYINDENKVIEDSKSTMNSEQVKVHETISTKVVESEDSKPSELLYSLLEFNNLSKENQALVLEADNESEKAFELGQLFILGEKGFPQIISLGLKYIEHSVKNECLDAIIYYIRLLIKGKLFPQDLEKAGEYITKSNQHKINGCFYSKVYGVVN